MLGMKHYRVNNSKKTQKTIIKGGLNMLKQRTVWWTQRDSYGVVIVALIPSSNGYRDLL